MGSPADAETLYGVSGDGATSNPESLFSISTIDASTTLVQALGNGEDGESIAYRTVDGLMYHWSGIPPTMETVNLDDQTVTNIPTDFAYNPFNVWGSTYDPVNDIFLLTDTRKNLGSATPGGTFALIGSLSPNNIRALVFNGGKLYGGGRRNDQLYELNPATAAVLSQVTVTLAGFTVEGINGLSTDPATGILYALIKTGGGIQDPTGRRLATLDPLTGTATDIGSLPDGMANIEFDLVPSTPVPAASQGWLVVLALAMAGTAFWMVVSRRWPVHD
jgi:hypothetical protein